MNVMQCERMNNDENLNESLPMVDLKALPEFLLGEI